ncbi:hypothetical protein LI012_06305 [Caldibacillus thermoamylovorans]|uniref:hypothetical protein n=1 Tax=Caldibacillus thermoamylovorans TaxID=35841 RepID=UPI001D09066C|nr:hypothetical protein [Caldibacillus thermoamylovorans]MCB5934464.1 hypothetical protein [Bacillus sp. DFI.2.34]MCB7076439.1 hypothetical protein [Caldibacillus thermoamylovorans]
MITATEARKLSFEAKESIASNAICSLMEKVKSNAQKGVFQAEIDIYKIPFFMTITDQIIQCFENNGFAVSVTELDTAIKITVSWWEE